jgi:hypothetical protein
MDKNPPPMNFSFGPRPRMGDFADRPGRYEPAIRVLRPVINPGETLEVELFITGYGEIGRAKLTFYPSPDTFVERDSRLQFNLEKKEGLIVWAGPHRMFSEVGVVISLSGGYKDTRWQESTLFFDCSAASPPQIITETKQINAPFTFSLVTRDHVAPGTYLLQFYLTYFNGTEWCMSSQQASFTIRSLLQRHETAVAVVASLAAAATIIPALFDTVAVIHGMLK